MSHVSIETPFRWDFNDLLSVRGNQSRTIGRLGGGRGRRTGGEERRGGGGGGGEEDAG